MGAADYILSQLESLTNYDTTPKNGESLEDFLIRCTLSKKFRKHSVDEDFRQHLLRIANNSVANGQPLPFVWDFGGYKLWRFPESPEVDWAELFSLIHFSRWLLPIAAAYKPGVWFDFYSEDIFVPQINNVPAADTAAYIASFTALLKFMENYLPANFRFTLNRLIDQYDSPESFKGEFEQNLTTLSRDLPGGLPQLTPEQRATVELNVKLFERQDADPLWREKVQLIHDAYSLASKRRPYYRNASKILVNNLPTKCAITVGTTKTSVVKFWVGVGALARRNNGYIECILSDKQLQSSSFQYEPIRIPKLIGRNFQKIRILDEPYKLR